MKLSIIIPSYNEQHTIIELLKSVQAVHFPIEYEIIIVDDGSEDRTLENEAFIKKNSEARNIRIFRNRINRGKSFSIRKGIQHAKGDLLIVQDADHEYDPNDIPSLLEPILRGEADAVYGSRFLAQKHPEGMARPNWIANKMLTWITNALFRTQLTDLETCYKVFKTGHLRALPLKSVRFSFEPEVTGLLSKKGIKIVERPVHYSGRTAKEGKKIKARDFFFAIFTMLRVAFYKDKA